MVVGCGLIVVGWGWPGAAAAGGGKPETVRNREIRIIPGRFYRWNNAM